jgi:hypothetical protein
MVKRSGVYLKTSRMDGRIEFERKLVYELKMKENPSA